MRLIKNKEANGTLARREWWSLNHAYEAMVGYEDGKCSINIIGQAGDLSLSIGNKLNKEFSRRYSISRTIDSSFIEVPEGELKEVLSLIERYC